MKSHRLDIAGLWVLLVIAFLCVTIRLICVEKDQERESALEKRVRAIEELIEPEGQK